MIHILKEDYGKLKGGIINDTIRLIKRDRRVSVAGLDIDLYVLDGERTDKMDLGGGDQREYSID
ncbi:hypothetical protein UT300012_23010 [Paraclostridium bifermentans]